MKKPLVTMLLVLGTVTLQAQLAGAQAQPGAAAGQSQPATQKKEIKDPAEYNAYVNAVQQQDPSAKAAALEAFVKAYPNSVMKETSLELLMGAYQQAGDSPKTIDAANRVLQANPNNLRALALLAYIYRMSGTPDDVPKAGETGQKGLAAVQSAQKPDEMNDADFDKLKKETSIIFNGAAGFAAMNAKDWAIAQKYLRAAVELAGPSPSFIDIYQLSLADLEAKPINPEGLYIVAHAIAVAPNPQAKQQISDYGKKKYVRYHGGEDGWADLVTAAAATPLPPAGYKDPAIYVPPTLEQQADDLIKSKQVKDMGFAEWQLILSSKNQAAADKVWNTIHDKLIILQAYVISATPTKLDLAGSEDDKDAGKADITLTMETPIPARYIPVAGKLIPFQAVPNTYTQDPFMMNMTEGALLGPDQKPLVFKKAPVRPAARRKAQ